MQVNPYLTFNGNCEEAFKAYAKILGAEIVAMIPHEGTPAEASTPTEWRKKIIHARIIGDGFMLMGSDSPPAYYEPMKGFSVMLSCEGTGTSRARVRRACRQRAACAWRSPRRSGQRNLGCSPTNSARRG